MPWDVLPAADQITQPFGCCDSLAEWWAPWCPLHRFHSGIDLGNSHGGWSIYKAPVYATRSGTVERVGYPNGLGPQAVFLRLDGGGWLIYGHLEQALCHVGDRLSVGQWFALLGTRGNSTAPHLHLEYRTDGPLQNVDHDAGGVGNPVPFLYAADVQPDERAALLWVRQTLEQVWTADPAWPIAKQLAALKAEVDQLKASGAGGPTPAPSALSITLTGEATPK
jgi:murein DD-endopeptidase MepM/ murein hydrolase activator NlpD